MQADERSTKEFYNEHGYAVFANTLSPDDLQPLISGIERGVDQRANELLTEGKITDLYRNEPYDKRLASLFRGHEIGLRMWDEVVEASALEKFYRTPKLLDALETLVGPRITFSGDFHMRPKLPESTLTSFPWHQDSQYYGPPTKHLHIVTAWIPLVDVDEQNGCLWVIPGSHRWGLLHGERGGDQNMRTADDVEKRGKPVPVHMKRGDALLFTNLTFHASKLNLTDRVRWSIDLRYYPTRDLESMTQVERESHDFYTTKLRNHTRSATPVRGPAAGTHAVAIR